MTKQFLVVPSDNPPTGQSIFQKLADLKGNAVDCATINQECKSLNNNAVEHWYSLGSRLQKIHQLGLYHQAGYRSFSLYCKQAMGYSRQHIYKLIEVVRFVDEISASAKTDMQQANLQRLFMLGFTKIYLLSAFPIPMLETLFQDGVIVHQANLSLEQVTIQQLKHYLTQVKGESPAREKVAPIPNTLIGMLNTQSKTLLGIVDKCQSEVSNPEKMQEYLRLVKQHAYNLYENVQVLKNHSLLPD